MERERDRRIEVDGVTLGWGDAARLKAQLREESLQRHLALPLSERLRAALSLVLPRKTDEHRMKAPRTEDLLIHKFIKLRSDRSTLLQDLADMRAIVAAREGELQLDYVRRWLRPEESEIFTALESLDDEALARKVLRL